MATTRRAFTLVEMLLVVAIIVLLISILLPVLSQSRSTTRSAVCLANLGQFMDANVAFALDNGGYSVRTLEPRPGTPSGGVWWTSSLFAYRSGGAIKFCPEATSGATPQMGTLSIGSRHRSWFDGTQFPPASDETEVGSYGHNMWVSRFYGSMTNWGYPASHHWTGRLNIKYADEVPLFADSIWTGGYAYNTDAPGAVEGQMSGQTNRFALRRHLDNVNVVLLDGSAKNVELPDLWLLRWNKRSVPRPGVVVPWD